MRSNDVEDTVIQREVVRDAALVANHLTHRSLGDLRRVDIRELKNDFCLHKDQEEHFPHVDKLA